MTVQRREVERFEAVVVGGPADGLRLACKRMSDGERFVLAGGLYDIDPYDYEFSPDESQLIFKGDA